jgi:uncharacterized protein (DUF697 family)
MTNPEPKSNGFIKLWHQIKTSAVEGLDQVTKTATGWFTIKEEDLSEILAQVKEQLPTTEAILLGKTQSGKSSIVRSITGVSAEIIGEGYRPHTQYTSRYLYPTDDLPLITFTDTVGLGDINQSSTAIAEEIIRDLGQETAKAAILIVTVKSNDFATASLIETLKKIRGQYPQLPCLLAITCVHELYPSAMEDHPDYPPQLETVTRAIAQLEQDFAGLYDRSVVVDFTLEEDGFEPMFYGIEAFGEQLAELLPAAEAQTIHDLLDRDWDNQLGNIYRDTARRYLVVFSAAAATLAAVPLPIATMPALTAVQVSMVAVIGKLYNQKLNLSQAGGVMSAIAGGFLAQMVGRELVKFIPVFGSVVAASWAAAYTWALGEGACVYFGDLMGGKKPDPAKIQEVMATAFTNAKIRFKALGQDQSEKLES